MRALVVYESMYGNTHLVADTIGRGLEVMADVSVLAVHDADDAVWRVSISLSSAGRRRCTA